MGSTTPELCGTTEDSQRVQHYVSEQLEDLEQRLETFLDQMSEDIALEVEREQQHLMLMQDQVSETACSYTGEAIKILQDP